MTAPITPRQKELLLMIYKYIKNSGYPPTMEEMRQSLNVSSNQSVIDLLNHLKNKKFIKRNKNIARSIALLSGAYQALDQPILAPFLGLTHAGIPSEAIHIEGDWQPLSSDTAILKDKIFLLKISGDSMVNAGIDDGDIVMVKEHKEFITGDIVLAQIGDQSTVKRFISEHKPPYLYLKPENPNHKIIHFTEEVQMTGKVISILKQGAWKSVN